MFGLGLLTLFFALLFLLYGMLFRICINRFGSVVTIIYPTIWILLEYLRTLGDISFPWTFSGYALVPILYISQIVSITGIYGLSFFVITGNVAVFNLIKAIYVNKSVKSKIVYPFILCILVTVMCIWGFFRIQKNKDMNDKIRISLIQSKMDQANWNGRISLDTSLAITQKMVYSTVQENPDLILFPESGIYCYLEKQKNEKALVSKWSDSLDIPFIIGTLHWEKMKDDPYYKYKVYNSIFLLEKGALTFHKYHKIKLVPFSEALPFEGIFPILSRINLGESDFQRGKDETVFKFKDRSNYSIAPFLCYEIIYPDFVRKRISKGAAMLVNLTNDSWFGFSTAPYHHANMARTRSIENGVSMARCANSGISMLVDPVGRVIKKTSLYERTVLTGNIPSRTIHTFYMKYGNCFLWMMASISLCLVGYIFFKKTFFQTEHKSLKKE
jgi:apolipoprotein N-acyltransferase